MKMALSSSLMGLVLVWVVSCSSGGGRHDGPTKEEVASGKADDGVDWCEEMGWYKDGICDTFCHRPDPACFDGGDGAADGGDGAVDGGDGADATCMCPPSDYPIQVSVDDDRLEAAMQQVEQLSAQYGPVTVRFSKSTGTVRNLDGRIPLDLDGQGSLCDQQLRAVDTFIDDWVELFQVDISQFEVYRCVPQPELDTYTLVLRRYQYSGLELFAGNQRISATFKEGGATLTQAQGKYLPMPDLSLGDCVCLDESAAALVPVGVSVEYLVFQSCTIVGRGEYTIADSDVVEITGLGVDMTHDVHSELPAELRLVWKAEVYVAPANWTPDLQASGAYCPTERGQIGWSLLIDAMTGEVVGLVPRCIVC
jgi:hypothetical protein